MEELLKEEVVANATEEAVESLEDLTNTKFLVKIGGAIVIVGAGYLLYKKVAKPVAKKLKDKIKSKKENSEIVVTEVNETEEDSTKEFQA